MGAVKKLPTAEESICNAKSFDDMMELSMLGLHPQNSMVKHPTYKVKVYVEHGCYEYEVGNVGQAMAHAQEIMKSGVYRRAVDEETVEFYKCYKVKVISNIRDLGSQYSDKFVRT